MATRCTVRVVRVDFCKLYIHWDGDPSSKLPFLEKFNKEFTEKRGDDSSYKIAQLIRATALMQDEFNLDSSVTTGYGLVRANDDCGVDYEYVLNKDGTVSYSETD